MKKNKGLIVGIVVAVILAAIAVWYFFFRGNAASKLATPDTGMTGGAGDVVAGGTGPTGNGYDCPDGTTGTYPNCVDPVFENALSLAKQKVENSSTLDKVQKSNVLNIINIDVVKNKYTLLADAKAGKGSLDQLILIDAQKIYLLKYKSSVQL